MAEYQSDKRSKPGRPKKQPDKLRSADLRIPVTAAEKKLIQDAVAIDSRTGDLAAWAREILLEFAGQIVDDAEAR